MRPNFKQLRDLLNESITFGIVVSFLFVILTSYGFGLGDVRNGDMVVRSVISIIAACVGITLGLMWSEHCKKKSRQPMPEADIDELIEMMESERDELDNLIIRLQGFAARLPEVLEHSQRHDLQPRVARLQNYLKALSQVSASSAPEIDWNATLREIQRAKGTK